MKNKQMTRRDFVRTSAVAGFSATVSGSSTPAPGCKAEEKPAPPVNNTAPDQDTLANNMPYGKIGNLKISRLILVPTYRVLIRGILFMSLLWAGHITLLSEC